MLITLALGFAPDTTINTWAANEARVRLELQKKHDEDSDGDGDGDGDEDKHLVQFGKLYNVPEKVYDFDSTIVDDPFNEDEEDDEDDEDDDDEDEEE